MNSKIIAFAIDAHNKVNHHYNHYPYSVHLSMVVMYAMKYIDYLPSKEAQENVLSACWLHDTIEDCRLTFNDIRTIAGEDVANIVYAVSNEKGKNRKERANGKYYQGIRGTAWATYVKFCDRLANVKYSSDTKSTMLEVYQKENVDFINALCPDANTRNNYKLMIKELNELLGVSTPDA